MYLFNKKKTIFIIRTLFDLIGLQPLDSADQQELKKTLQAFAKKGETIKIELKVDPTIIGGIVVSIGDKYVDMSVATKIKKYTEIIQDAV